MAGNTFLWNFVCLCALVSLAEAKGDCFQFTGTGRVTFSYNDYNSGRMHFRLKFKTTSDKGVLYYSEGNYHRDRVYDFEGLFLWDGYLHFFLFNPNDFGVGSTFGFDGRSLEQLNDDEWHTVEFFRNIPTDVRQPDGTTRTVEQTGFRVDGVDQAVDNQSRQGVNLSNIVLLGEDPRLDERVSSSIGGYKGRIKDFEDVRNGAMFTTVENTGVARCVAGIPDPV